MHYHIAWDGFYKGSWTEARTKYGRIMQDNADVNFVTVLREPVSHYLSYYYYFINPLNKVNISVAIIGCVVWVAINQPAIEFSRAACTSRYCNTGVCITVAEGVMDSDMGGTSCDDLSDPYFVGVEMILSPWASLKTF